MARITCVNACEVPGCDNGWVRPAPHILATVDGHPCDCEGFECDGCETGGPCWVDGEVHLHEDGNAPSPAPGTGMLKQFFED